ncbi:integrase core domain-containing protein, partial [Bifidobacterium hapali]
RDRVAQKLARGPRARQALRTRRVPRLPEVPVHRGRAHRHQFVEREPVVLGKLATGSQRGQPQGQHLLEVLRARQIHHQPHPHQQLARLLRIPFRPCLPGRRQLARLRAGLGEPAPRGASADLQHGAHLVEDAPLVLLRCLHVLVPEPQGDLPLRRHADLAFHTTSQTGPVPFALISDEAPLAITRSKNVSHVGGAPKIRQHDNVIEFANPISVSAAADIDPNQLFDRFYQADHARSSKGSGLGLAVAQSLAQAMRLRLTARLECGSVLSDSNDNSASSNATSLIITIMPA